jgi:hypothetical protein
MQESRRGPGALSSIQGYGGCLQHALPPKRFEDSLHDQRIIKLPMDGPGPVHLIQLNTMLPPAGSSLRRRMARMADVQRHPSLHNISTTRFGIWHGGERYPLVPFNLGSVSPSVCEHIKAAHSVGKPPRKFEGNRTEG